jgi:hypothetical protein
VVELIASISSCLFMCATPRVEGPTLCRPIQATPYRTEAQRRKPPDGRDAHLRVATDADRAMCLPALRSPAVRFAPRTLRFREVPATLPYAGGPVDKPVPSRA